MLNGSKISKVAVIWTTIVYVVCLLFIWIFPDFSQTILDWLVHGNMIDVFKPGVRLFPAIAGLIVWDILVYLSVSLFVWLYNKQN